MNTGTKTDPFCDSSRRDFLKKGILLTTSTSIWANEPSVDETLLHVVRNGNAYKIPFMRDGKLEENGYFDLCRIFADMHDQVAVKMDPDLFTVLARAQGWLAEHKIYKPIILTSGYRTEHTNSKTEGAARNSMHLYGKAADIHMEGIPINYLARLMRISGGAGIGFYSNFVHVDTWKERAWRG